MKTHKQRLEETVPFELRDYQHTTLEELENWNHHTLICMPTGAGKTLIAEFIILKTLMLGKKVVFTTPLKALSSEKIDDWSNSKFWVNKHTKVKVLLDTGDTSAKRSEMGMSYYNQDWNVLITTNERLDSIFRTRNKRETILDNIGVVIFDEIHLLGSAGRGGTVEFLIMLIKNWLNNTSIVGLSATLPNSEQFSEWLGSKLIMIPEDKRPVPLSDIFYDPIPFGLKVKEKTAYKKSQLTQIVKNRANEQFLVFCSSRKRTESLAEEMCITLTGQRLKSKPSLKKMIQMGCAYHNAGLTREERTLVEQAFKRKQIKVLFATPTLAQGVNLPATNVVMFDLSRWNAFVGSHQVLEHYEIGQMRGRAGRPGYDTKGRCFYLGDKRELREAYAATKNPQNMNSQLEDLLDEKILSSNVSYMATSDEEITSLFSSTFGFTQKRINMEMVYEELGFLVESEFMNYIDHMQIYKPTLKGKLTSYMYLKPRTVQEVTRNLVKLKAKRNVTKLDIAKAFLLNADILSQIRVSGNDEGLVREAMRVFEITNAYTTEYNTSGKNWQVMDRTQEFSKLLAFVFSDEIKRKLFVSAAEISMLRNEASLFISRMWNILQKTETTMKFLTEDSVKMVKALVQQGTLDEKKAELIMIPLIGEKSIEKLKIIGVNTVQEFLLKPDALLAKVLNKTPQTIGKIKKSASEMFPQYKATSSQNKLQI